MRRLIVGIGIELFLVACTAEAPLPTAIASMASAQATPPATMSTPRRSEPPAIISNRQFSEPPATTSTQRLSEPHACPTPLNLNADRDYAATIEDLVADSDAIVIGVLKPRSVVDSMSSDEEFHHLAQDFLVEEVLVGSVKVSETILVLRSIRAEDACPIVEFDARPLQVGNRYLFFLRLEKDIYVSSGGPQGQYSLDDGVLDAMTDRMPVVEEFDGKTVDAARQMIRASERP